MESGFNFDNAQYGRSEAQLEKYINDLSTHLRSLEEYIIDTGDLVKVIRQNWSGADEVKFEKKLEKIKADTREVLYHVGEDIALSLRDDVKNFNKMQNNIEF